MISFNPKEFIAADVRNDPPHPKYPDLATYSLHVLVPHLHLYPSLPAHICSLEKDLNRD
jgi:hypothetical protein